MKRIPIPAPLIAIAVLFLAASAQAAEFCATNHAELSLALSAAATNGENDTIRVQTGTYRITGNANNTYTYDAFQEGGDDHDLTLIGGWIESDDNPCGLPGPQHPKYTMVYGEDIARAMRINIRENSSLTVRLLTFFHGKVPPVAPGVNPNGGGLAVVVGHDPEGGYTGRIIIERNMFLNNEGFNGGGLWVGKSTGSAYTAIGSSRLGVVNNVFSGNHARNLFSAAQLKQDGEDDGPFGVGIYVTNNTVLSNTQEGGGSGHFGGFDLSGNTPNVYVINNNMWGNDDADLSVRISFQPGINRVYRLMNNNIGIHDSHPTHDFGNISVEPEIEPCYVCFNWVPTVNSPLVDAGTHPGNFSPFWTMPTLDAAGNLRVAQDTVDIGAYENHDRFFADRFESSN